MTAPSKRLAEAWDSVRAEAPDPREKPKEFGPPQRESGEQKPFRMPEDPFAQLRGGPDSAPVPEPAARPDEPEPEPVSSERATNGVHRESDGEAWVLLAGWAEDCDGGPVS